MHAVGQGQSPAERDEDWPLVGGFSHTATDFDVEAAAIGRLTAEKNVAYGDSFARSGEIMRIFYPDGIAPEQMDDALGVVRVIDKLFRIATRKEAFGENPWRDLAGYGLVAVVRELRAQRARATECGEQRFARGTEE
jgi:hypothetical protein